MRPEPADLTELRPHIGVPEIAKRGGGAIVNIASVQAVAVCQGNSKSGGVTAMTETDREEPWCVAPIGDRCGEGAVWARVEPGAAHCN
jgi:hypothetical protein